MVVYDASTNTRLEERIDQTHPSMGRCGTIDHPWLQEYCQSLPLSSSGKTHPMEDYRDAYQFGLRSRLQNKASYAEVAPLLEEAWNDLIGASVLDWEEAEPIIRQAYNSSKIKPPRKLKVLRHVAA